MKSNTAAGLVLFLMIAAAGACSNSSDLKSSNGGSLATTRPKDAPPDKVLSIPVGDSDTPYKKATSCKVDDESIASCDPKTGQITGKAPGTTAVTFKTPDGERVVKVTVTPVVSASSGASTGSAGGATEGTGTGGVGTDGGSSGGATTGVGSDGLSVDEQAFVAQLSGVAVTKVGVNFEDLPGGDNDYNDAVLCFTGKFKVEGANVISTATQKVVGTTMSNSGCHHTLLIRVTHLDGQVESPLQFDSRNAQPVNMNFKVGSRLDVTMTSYDGPCDRNPHGMGEARVAPNLCNQ